MAPDPIGLELDPGDSIGGVDPWVLSEILAQKSWRSGLHVSKLFHDVRKITLSHTYLFHPQTTLISTSLSQLSLVFFNLHLGQITAVSTSSLPSCPKASSSLHHHSLPPFFTTIHVKLLVCCFGVWIVLSRDLTNLNQLNQTTTTTTTPRVTIDHNSIQSPQSCLNQALMSFRLRSASS